jgi:hypothetical protein
MEMDGSVDVRIELAGYTRGTGSAGSSYHNDSTKG